MADVPLSDVQGLVMRGYAMPTLRVFVLAIDDADGARRFLASLVDGGGLVPQLTTAAQWASKPDVCVNVALTYGGLGALQLPPSALASFPEEFVAGAAARADLVGDTDASAPEHWKGELAGPRVHMLLCLFAQSESLLEASSSALRTAYGHNAACVELSCHDARGLPGNVAHFGYRDGFAQPTIEGGLPPLLPDVLPAAPAGAFLLGHPSQYAGFTYPVPELIGANGSFVAFRILAQDCAAFEQFLRDGARQTGLDAELLAAKLCGRWRNGVPLALAPASPDADIPLERYNSFDYLPTAGVPDAYDDRRGYRCPIGAHVRRMNPRHSAVAGNSGLKRRVVRRGLPYGAPYDPDTPNDGIERGLLGLFIGVSLKDQFEFLMSDWANKGTFAPGLRETKDPVLGDNTAPGAKFLIPVEGRRAPMEVDGLSRFVTCRGAAYGFLPSTSAIRYLAHNV